MSEDKIQEWATRLARQIDQFCGDPIGELDDFFEGLEALVRWTADVIVDEGDFWTGPSWHTENERVDVEVWDAEGIRVPHVEQRLTYWLN